MLEPFLCGLVAQALLLPKLRSHFAEFLDNASPAGLRILSSSTCVGLRYGHTYSNSGFSWHMLIALRYFRFAPHQQAPLRIRTSLIPGSCLAPGFPFPARALHMRPRSSVYVWYWNLNQLSIGYAFQPDLRSRLTQGRSALPWKPWIFGLKDSHLHLATHSGILSSRKSTAPYRYRFFPTAMLLYRSLRDP